VVFNNLDMSHNETSLPWSGQDMKIMITRITPPVVTLLSLCSGDPGHRLKS